MKCAALLPLALAACAANAGTRHHDGHGDAGTHPGVKNASGTTRLGQTLRLDTIAITPIQIVEDSRCPAGVTCVWAGRFLLIARVSQPGGTKTPQLELGRGYALEDSRNLRFVGVSPPRTGKAAPHAQSWRFTFALGPGD